LLQQEDVPIVEFILIISAIIFLASDSLKNR
jgi:hypothetical protein